jgi:solute:Na+ symporter, SSS family
MMVYIGGAILASVVIIASSDGGLSALLQTASAGDKLRLFDLSFSTGFFERPYTLVAGLLGGAFLSMASHGTDQLIVQRVLTTKTLKASRKALLGSGVVVILQFALFLGVGVLLFGSYNGASLSDLGLSR